LGRFKDEVKKVLHAMCEEFEITSSTAKYYLGIEIDHDRK